MSERDMLRLLRLVERNLGKEWVEIGDWLRGLPANQLAEIEAKLVIGDYGGLVSEVESAARTFAAATQAEYERAGRASAKWLDKQPKLAERLVRFDVTNDRAVRAAQRNELELVRGLTQEMRETIMRVVTDGQRAGLNPRQVARDIRDSITLTPHQAQHVTNYRRALEQGDYGNALGRELRDARSDSRLRRLQRDGGQLTEKQIESIVIGHPKYVKAKLAYFEVREQEENLRAIRDALFQRNGALMAILTNHRSEENTDPGSRIDRK